MLPTLAGDERAGDRVLVNLIAPRLRGPRRFEIVAFHDPQNRGRDLVKRIVALPGETIFLREGDLKINNEIYRKNAAERRLLRIPLFRSDRHPVRDGFAFESKYVQVTTKNELRVAAGGAGEDGVVILSKIPPTDGFERDDGDYQHHDRELPVWDLQLEMQAELLGETGELSVKLNFEGDEYIYNLKRLSGNGETALKITRMSIVRQGAGVGKESAILFDGPGPAWRKGERKSLVFTNMDCTLSLEIDGEEFRGGGELPYLCTSHHPYISGSGISPRSRTGVQFSVAGCDAVIGALSIYRDLYYESKGSFGCQQEYRLGENQYFVLGDYSYDSADSRVFGAVSKEGILGYVSAILLPMSRRRWL